MVSTDPGPSPLLKWLIAATSCSFAEAVTFPFDVAKVRMQLQNELGSSAQNKGMIQMLSTVYRQEGVCSLYSGLSAAVLRQSVYGGVGIGEISVLQNE